MAVKRSHIAGLSLSAAALVALLSTEGYTDRAVVPVKGDRPTVGYGSTFRDDGSPVQMGDAITPPQAIKRSYAHIAKDERGLKHCVTGELYQAEYDMLVDHSYQYGVAATCGSSMVRLVNAGQYRQACEQPRYPLTVYLNGSIDASGTLFNADLHKISWKVIPSNSGVRTLRTKPRRARPGSAPSSTRTP